MKWLGLFVVTTMAVGVLEAGEKSIQPVLPINKDAVARINALKPNQAAIIGKAEVVGEFNDVARRYDLHKTGPRGRDFTIRMVWAPERRRALFCGANHGVPHRLNDVWEFDLTALAWIMLYAPDNPRDYTGIGKDYSDVDSRMDCSSPKGADPRSSLIPGGASPTIRSSSACCS